MITTITTGTFFIVMLFVLSLFLSFESYITKKIQLKQARKLKNLTKDKRVELFIWLADEPSLDTLMYEILGDEKDTGNFKRNIGTIKEKVEKYIGNNIDDYLIIKDLLNQRLQSGIETLFRNLLKPILTSIVTSVITTSLLNKIELKIVHENIIFIIFGIIILTLYVFFSYNFRFTRRRNRIEILIIIINTIINKKTTVK